MVIIEIIEINKKPFCRHYSDNNKYIKQVQTGKEFTEAENLYPCGYTYIETEREIENIGEVDYNE